MDFIRNVEKLAARTARAAWPLVKLFNAKFERPAPKPEWAPAPLLKRRERTFPQLGWPRKTDSLCPRCVKETREAILDGKSALRELIVGKPGEIKAEILEEDGQIVMRKTCAKHGTFTDVMAIDPKWLARIERLYPGRDFKAPKTALREHGSSSIQFGRGSVLTVDLTNRCNMMCDPCFMDANQVGYVHELGWDDIKKILDDAMSIKPRRQMSVQFSGGEPTLSPLFLDAIRYAREIGYFAVQCATNGLRFAEEPGFAQEGQGGRPAHGVPAVRRHRQRGQRAPQDRQPLRRQAARHRGAGRGGHRRHPGGHRRQRRQQRPGRQDPAVRRRERRQDHRGLVPAGVVHRPRRGHRRRDARQAALHAVAPRLRRARRRPASPSRCATGSRSRRWGRSPISSTT